MFAGRIQETSLSDAGCQVAYNYTKALSSFYGSSVFLYEQKKKQVAQNFESNKLEWENLTIFASSVSDLINNTPYRNIINLGQDVLPFLLNDLSKTQSHWFYALMQITGENPVSEHDAGDIEAMTKSWLNWGHNHQVL